MANTTWVQVNRALDTRNPRIYKHTLPAFVYEVDEQWATDPANAGYAPTKTEQPATAVTIRKPAKPAKQTEDKTNNDTETNVEDAE